ncbi:hypothetical protein QTN25_005471 [Entamoeba marina]
MIAQNNHNILFDSSKTTTINRRKLQTGIQGYKGIVGKQHNGVYNPTIWEREGGIESIDIYYPKYCDDILEVFDAFIIHKNSFIEVSYDSKQSYECGDDELTSKEKPKM